MKDLPPPLVHADLDLRDYEYLLVSIDYLTKSDFSQRCTAAEWRANLLLMCASWHEVPCSSVPNDDHALAHLAQVSSVRRWKRLRPSVIGEWELCSDGRFYHPMVAERALATWAKHLRLLARTNRRLEMLSGEWAAARSAAFRRDDFTCQYCGARGVALECDHVVPLSRGGASVLDNLLTACRSCNRRKGARTVEEWLR